MLMEVQLTITPWKVCANYGHIWNKTQLFFSWPYLSWLLVFKEEVLEQYTGVILYWNNGFRKIGYHLCWSERHLIDHYNNVILSAIAIVYSTVYSGADKKNIKAPRHSPLWGLFTGDWWISIWWRHHVARIHPMNCVHGLFISIRVTSQALGQGEATLKDCGKYIAAIARK